jgi:choline dehydrogenase-like flavoprotein
MLFDFNKAWPRVAEAQYDVCVCGAGPAGITIARKLAARGKKVLLLEAGGLSYSNESQDHYKGRSVGHTFWWLETGRLRYFGGTSNHWSGICGIMDSITFEKNRDDLRLPGWPISREEILRNLDEAEEILDIPGANFSRSKQPDFDSPWFDQYPFVFSPPTRFSEKYGPEIKQSKQIDAFYTPFTSQPENPLD